MFREYFEMEQNLFNKIESEKKFSFRKLLRLIELSGMTKHQAF